MEEGVRILGTVPTKERIVAERFFDDSGGMQLVIHSPFGSRINRAWGMSLRKEICRAFDFELQAAATEDGINLSLGPSQSFPLGDVFKYIHPAKVEKVLTQAILQAPIFGLRWRWDASRALAVLRFSGGKKVPAPLQRMRSEDLLAAVFPEQVACQDNAMPGDIEVPDHPIVFETMRDCTTEAMDLWGLKALLERIRSGDVEVYARDTTQPSVFSHQILNAMPYAFLDDAPLEERRSRAVALRRALPEDSRELGKLDEAAIHAAAADAWPFVRDADELHDALLTLGLMPEAALARGSAPPGVDRAREWYAALVGGRPRGHGLVCRGTHGLGRRRIGPHSAGSVPGHPIRADAAGQDSVLHPRPPRTTPCSSWFADGWRALARSPRPRWPTRSGCGRARWTSPSLAWRPAVESSGATSRRACKGRGGLRPTHSRQDSPSHRHPSAQGGGAGLRGGLRALPVRLAARLGPPKGAMPRC